MWNGVNYLLKIPSDLNFLDVYSPLITWLGFPMIRNPFAIPIMLDERPVTPSRPNHFSLGESSLRAFGGVGSGVGGGPANATNISMISVDSGAAGFAVGGDGTFTTIGGLDTPSNVLSASEPWGTIGSVGPVGHAFDTPASSARVGGEGDHTSGQFGSTGASDMSSTLLAYKTPVINDMDMLPSRAMSQAPPRTQGRTAARPLPSHIGDLDMLRVREAEKLILQVR